MERKIKNCSEKIKESLYDCAAILISRSDVDEKYTLAQTIGTLSESLRILNDIKGKEGDE